MVRATPQIIAICLFVYVAQLAVAVVEGRTRMIELFALSLPFDAYSWTVVTSVYAHKTALHLLSNLTLFALLGLAVERQTTATRFHLFVLLTGATANLSQAGFSSLVVGVDAHVLGLSGAVFALLGYVLTGNRLSGFLLDRFEVPRSLQFMIYLVLAMVVTVATAEPGVALIGHFTGLFVGLGLGAMGVLQPQSTGEEFSPPAR